MFKVLFLFYMIICILFLYYWFVKEKKGIINCITRSFILLFFPVLGLIYLIISDQIERKDRVTFVREIENIFTIEHQEMTMYKKVNTNKEMNMVPLEETLLMNDTKVKRRLLLDALKEDSLQRISVLEMALKDADTETSHYAATALVEVKRKLLLDLQELEIQYEKDHKNIEILVLYTDVLKKFLSIPLLDQRTYRKYNHLYLAMLENLLEVYQKEEQYFVEKIKGELQQYDYLKVQRYCDQFRACFPDSETPFLMLMNYYYEIKDTESFNRTLKELKSSHVQLSHKGLTSVRFWGNGAGSVSQTVGEKACG